MKLDQLYSTEFILASGSPRRQFLVKDLGLSFVVKVSDVDEHFPDDLKAQEIPLFLSKLKAEAFKDDLGDRILIAADTVVWINNQVLNKPADAEEAKSMLRMLSANRHEVYTGVTLRSAKKTVSFHSRTDVYFKVLTEEEITFYVDKYKPFDKAGAYGAQEWIGYVGVEKISGSYFNVMGLPLRELYETILKEF